jgi:hypothetical protein
VEQIWSDFWAHASSSSSSAKTGKSDREIKAGEGDSNQDKGQINGGTGTEKTYPSVSPVSKLEPVSEK